MRHQVATDHCKPRLGLLRMHGSQAGLEQRIRSIHAARVALVLQRIKALLPIRRRRPGENRIPGARRRRLQLCRLRWIPERLKMNVAHHQCRNAMVPG